MKTYQPKGKEVIRSWHLIDAKDEILGRLATKVVSLLMGKGKVSYSPHMDSGDFVVILNAEKIKLTGKKETDKVYQGHSGYPGGFKEVSIVKMRKEHPIRIIQKAVFGMLPDNRLRSKRMVRLMLVEGDKNPYQAKFKQNDKEN
jgi:large subunit ribosomal protein L13